MDLSLFFAGTGGSVPSARRGLPAILMRLGGDRILFDCGEGTQRQLLRSTVGLVDVGEIFLTHFHADHYLGLPGMLKTFGLRGRETPLTVYGPPGLRDLFGSLRCIFGKVSYPIDAEEWRRWSNPEFLLNDNGVRLEDSLAVLEEVIAARPLDPVAPANAVWPYGARADFADGESLTQRSLWSIVQSWLPEAMEQFGSIPALTAATVHALGEGCTVVDAMMVARPPASIAERK